jgi:putative ABC transport system substrate-binding protein
VNRRSLCSAVAVSLAFATVALLPAPLACAADPAQSVVRVGFVGPGSASTAARGVSAFQERLRELGWVEGGNLVIEFRWGEGSVDRLPALIAEVLARKVDVLVTWGTPTALAARDATRTVPIVATAMGEPLRTGLAASLARPGGNLTGLSLGWGEGVAGKWLELLQEIVPRLSTVAVIANPENPVEREMLNDLRASAATRRLKLRIIEVREPKALELAMDQARQQARALLVFGDALLLAHSHQITASAIKHRLAGMYVLRDFVEAGGLMSYGPDLTVMARRAADYVDKILRGAKPGDLPIEQPTKYSLIVNLGAAQALKLAIPESILLRADEVIR